MDESVFQQIVYQRGGQGWIHVGPDVLFLDDVYLDAKAFVDFLEVFKCNKLSPVVSMNVKIY